VSDALFLRVRQIQGRKDASCNFVHTYLNVKEIHLKNCWKRELPFFLCLENYLIYVKLNCSTALHGVLAGLLPPVKVNPADVHSRVWESESVVTGSGHGK
jgi:hypothetical protein